MINMPKFLTGNIKLQSKLTFITKYKLFVLLIQPKGKQSYYHNLVEPVSQGRSMQDEKRTGTALGSGMSISFVLFVVAPAHRTSSCELEEAKAERRASKEEWCVCMCARALCMQRIGAFKCMECLHFIWVVYYIEVLLTWADPHREKGGALALN